MPDGVPACPHHPRYSLLGLEDHSRLQRSDSTSSSTQEMMENTTLRTAPCAPGSGVWGSDGTSKGEVPRVVPAQSHTPAWVSHALGSGQRLLCWNRGYTPSIGSQTRSRWMCDAVSAGSRAGGRQTGTSAHRGGVLLQGEGTVQPKGRPQARPHGPRGMGNGVGGHPQAVCKHSFCSSSTA